MNKLTKTFQCSCGCKEFSKLRSFSIDFKTVNFTYDVIYDMIRDEKYVCFECGREYSKELIEQSLCNIIERYKEDYWEDRDGG